jgi:hypothetical protein
MSVISSRRNALLLQKEEWGSLFLFLFHLDSAAYTVREVSPLCLLTTASLLRKHLQEIPGRNAFPVP